VSQVSTEIKEAVGRLLTVEQKRRAAAALDNAIARWVARDRE